MCTVVGAATESLMHFDSWQCIQLCVSESEVKRVLHYDWLRWGFYKGLELLTVSTVPHLVSSLCSTCSNHKGF